MAERPQQGAMMPCSDPVLARAAELYADGMSLEADGEPQLALDRYRRAVRMADERKILALLRQQGHEHCMPISTSQASSGTSGPNVEATIAPPSSFSNDEEFQLWRALHMSRLEAQAQVGVSDAPPPSTADRRSESFRGPATADALTKDLAAFAPPPRRAPCAEAQEELADENVEESDRLTLRSLRTRLHVDRVSAPEASPSEASTVASTPKVSKAIAASDADNKDSSLDSSPLLTSNVPEVLPDVFFYLDPYGLDRTARVCRKLRRLARETPVWHTIAERCLPPEVYQRATVNNPVKEYKRWRRIVLSEPRLRMDGIYIAPCGYNRRVAKGASLTDSRESMYIRYFRLLRVLPEESREEPRRRILVLTYEGELQTAVDALKTHPVGHDTTFGAGVKTAGEATAAARKLHDRAIVANYEFDSEQKHLTVRYSNAHNEFKMEFQLLNASKNGSRQNCRLNWLSYEWAPLKYPNQRDTYNLTRDQHYAPYAFARVRALEHVF